MSESINNMDFVAGGTKLAAKITGSYQLMVTGIQFLIF
jgi:hypothetical protein